MAGRLSLFVLLLHFCNIKVQAQDVHLIDHLAQYNMNWTASHPYLLDHAFQPFYQAGIRYEEGAGSFRSAYQDQRYSNMGFHSISQKAIKEWRLQGSFSYRKVLDRQIPYLLQKDAQPHHPFVLADQHVESWRGDQIDFSLTTLSPVYMNRFQSYASIRYSVSSGNRNAEPRPLYRHTDLFVELGQQTTLTPYLKIGIGGSIGQTLEDNSVGAYAVQDFSLYQLRGISTFTRNTFQAFQRNQRENTVAGKAFLSYSKKQDWGFIEISSSAGHYEARDGIAFPLEAGKVESRGLSIETGFNKQLSSDKNWQFGFSYSGLSSFATDPIFKAINYDLSRNKLNAQTAILLSAKKIRRIAIHMEYLDEHREETAGQDLFQFNNFKYQLTSDLVLPFGKGHTFWIKPALGHRVNLLMDAQSNSSGLIREIFDLERAYHGSSSFIGQVNARWLAPMDKNQFSLALDLSSEQTANQHYNSLSLEVGLLF